MIDWIAVLRAVGMKAWRLSIDEAKSGIGHVAFVVDRVSVAAAEELERQRDAAQGVDALHPDGRCTCGGGGSCEWCRSHCSGCGVRLTAQGVSVGKPEVPAAAGEDGSPPASSDACDFRPDSTAACSRGTQGCWKWHELDTLRAQLAEREAELAALRSSERERKPLVDRALSTFVGGYFDLSAVRELLNHERARRAKEKP